MPLHIVPITHKFGIISQSHKKQLQQRLAKKREELEKEIRLKKEKSEKYSLQITEEFVTKYNECSPKDKPYYDEQCIKMFEKIKRKLGISIDIDDISLQIAWAELSQLVQCNSPVQEDCMDVFIVSLEHARLSATHVATLFFLAETVIYWLRMDTINQPFLRALEIKLLKVGQLVFQRIYYNYVEGILDDKFELKEHLAVYLDGFDQSESVYSPYPDALLYMRYIVAVGQLLLQPLKEEDKIKKEMNAGLVENENEVVINMNNLKGQNDTVQTTLIETPTSDAIKVHDLSPTLWHSVDLYICVYEKNITGFIQDAALSLIECSLRMSEEHWIDCIHAMYIIGECAKCNLRSLDALLNIAEGRLPELYNKSSFSEVSNDQLNSSTMLLKNTKTSKEAGIKHWKWEIGCVYVEILSDIIIHGNQSLIRRKALLGTNINADEALRRKLNNNKLNSFGLLDMTKFYTGMNKSEEDWAWRIRYSAIKGLVRICKTLKGNTENEELRNICWSSLVVCQESEINTDVLEAIKVGQVGTKGEEFASKQEKIKNKATNQLKYKIQNNSYSSINMHCQMAKRLGELFMAPLYDKNVPLKNRSFNSSKFSKDQSLLLNKVKPDSGKKSNNKSTDSKTFKTTTLTNLNNYDDDDDNDILGVNQNKFRTTLKEEIEMRKNYEQTIPDYYSRKSYDLMRIVEDQYRKQVKQEYEKQIDDEN